MMFEDNIEQLDASILKVPRRLFITTTVAEHTVPVRM
jgi:hypothetical protein